MIDSKRNSRYIVKGQQVESQRSLSALFGPSRSGTTWLGASLSSHPDVAYRFEPFHRGENEPSIRRLDREMFADQTIDGNSIAKTIDVPFPAMCKPPFFPKSFLHSPAWLRGMLWALSRKSGLMTPMFVRMNAPSRATRVIFKEVEKLHILEWLLKHTDVPITYLLRDPRAVVASRVRGQVKRLMPTTRRKFLPDLLIRNHELNGKFGASVADMSNEAAEALLWRLDVERAFLAFERYRPVQIVYYENLVRDPLKETERVFEHQQLSFTKTTRDFIEMSRQPPSAIRRFLYGELPINRYFTVFRAPGNENSWVETLTDEQLADIDEVIDDSRVVQIARQNGVWPEVTELERVETNANPDGLTPVNGNPTR